MLGLNDKVSDSVALLSVHHALLHQQLTSHTSDKLALQIKDLQQAVKHYQEKSQWYEKKYEQSVESYDRLLLAFKASQRRVFGASSERFLDPNVSQADFFLTYPLSHWRKKKKIIRNRMHQPHQIRERNPRKRGRQKTRLLQRIYHDVTWSFPLRIKAERIVLYVMR